MVSFGVEDFVKRYGALKPSQFVDVVALSGDKADNIPGIVSVAVVSCTILVRGQQNLFLVGWHNKPAQLYMKAWISFYLTNASKT